MFFIVCLAYKYIKKIRYIYLLRTLQLQSNSFVILKILQLQSDSFVISRIVLIIYYLLIAIKFCKINLLNIIN